MTVAELLDRISGEELTEWMAYEAATGPLGPSRGDWLAALVASVVVNTARGRKGREAKVTDFLLKWKTAAPAGPPSEMLGQMLARRFGGTWDPGASATGGETE